MSNREILIIIASLVFFAAQDNKMDQVISDRKYCQRLLDDWQKKVEQCRRQGFIDEK